MNSRIWRNILMLMALGAAFVAAYILIIRPWEMRWGATDAEIAMTLPGDSAPCGATGPSCSSGEVISVSTRAVTIHAPAAAVWHWLIETGVGRGGWFSHEWLENLFATGSANAEAIKPELQSVQVGDHWLFSKLGNVATVTLVEPERVLSLDGWIFYLRPLDAQTTRLTVRYPMHADEFINAPMAFLIFEPAHFVMESGMMMGIKQRAERHQ